ncbi:hypothetical protein BH11MYX1_BH11MYX1_49940 [soil metagenome]
MTLDDLAIGAGSSELRAGRLDLAAARVVGELGPELLVACSRELGAEPGSVAFCHDELRGRRTGGRGGV